jgi:hypothetical protein
MWWSIAIAHPHYPSKFWIRQVATPLTEERAERARRYLQIWYRHSLRRKKNRTTHPTGRAPPTFRRVGLHLFLNFVGQNQIIAARIADLVERMP